MLGDIEQLQNKLSGKPYLIGARHLIWDQIITEINKIWDYFKIIEEEVYMTDEARSSHTTSISRIGN
jgi:hypothetical protein